MDTLKSGQPPYNGQTVYPLPIYCSYISTFEEGTTSAQWTKHSFPTCPLFRGSTVFAISNINLVFFLFFCHVQAHLHHYTSVDGMELEQLTQSMESLNSLVREYESLETTKGVPTVPKPRLRLA